MGFFVFLWWVVAVVQGFLGYGTAYRLTKEGGDDGVSLFGWLFVMGLASVIPGLGIWLWFQYQDGGDGGNDGNDGTRGVKDWNNMPNHERRRL